MNINAVDNENANVTNGESTMRTARNGNSAQASKTNVRVQTRSTETS